MINYDSVKELIDYLSSDSFKNLDCNKVYYLCDIISEEIYEAHLEEIA